MVRWFEVIAMAHLHPYYAEGALERGALPALKNSKQWNAGSGPSPTNRDRHPSDTDSSRFICLW